MDIPSRLRGEEIPLEYIGLSEVAWLKDDALDLIDHLSDYQKRGNSFNCLPNFVKKHADTCSVEPFTGEVLWRKYS